MVKLRFVAALSIAMFAQSETHAQSYPSHPIRLILPAAPGGQPDIASRLIANELGKQMGQQVVVDNRAGAGGLIGFEMIARAAPDGYTLGAGVFSIMTNPGLFAKLPYDTARDFQPVILQSKGVNLLAVTPALPVKSVQELIDYARAGPGKLSYGSQGVGTSAQLSLELFKIMTGTQIVQVSYKGIQQAITDVIAGQVHIVSDGLGSILPHVRSGKLRALGVTSLQRSPIVPELPTLAEAGIPGYEMASSSGYIVPARVPREIVLRLNAEFNKVLQSPTVTEKFAAMGSTIVGGTPEHFAEHMRSEIAKWGKVIKTAGIRAE